MAASSSNLDRLIVEIMAKSYEGSFSGGDVHGVVAQVSAAAHRDRAFYEERVGRLEKELKSLRDSASQRSSLSGQVEASGANAPANTATSKESQTLRTCNLQLIGDRTKLEEEVRKLKVTIVTLTNHTNVKESQTLRDVNLKLIGERTRLQEEARNCKAQIATLINTIATKESESSSNRVSADIANLHNELRKAKALNVTLTNTTEAGKEIHKLRSRNGMLQGDVTRLEQQVSNLQSIVRFNDIGEAGKEIHKLKSLNGMLHGDKSRLEMEVARLSTHNSGLMQGTKAAEEIQVLNITNGELRGKNERFAAESQQLRSEVRRLKGEVATLQKRVQSSPPVHAPTGPRFMGDGFTSGRPTHTASFGPRVVTVDAYRPRYALPAGPASKEPTNDGRLSPYDSTMSGGSYQAQQSVPLVQPGTWAAPAASPWSPFTSGPRLEECLGPVAHKRSPTETLPAAATKKARVTDPRLAATASHAVDSGDSQSQDGAQSTNRVTEVWNHTNGTGTRKDGAQATNKQSTPMAASVR